MSAPAPPPEPPTRRATTVGREDPPDHRSQAPGPAPTPVEADPYAWVAAAEARIARVEEHLVYGRYLQAVAEWAQCPDAWTPEGPA